MELGNWWPGSAGAVRGSTGRRKAGSSARFGMVPRIGVGIGDQGLVNWLLQGCG